MKYIIRLLTLGVVLSPFLSGYGVVLAPRASVVHNEVYASMIDEEVIPIPLTIPEKIEKISEKFGVSMDLMKKIVWCESRNNPNAIGDRGMSFGLVQIYLPAHPDITKEQALDENFALLFLAGELKKGNGRIWTCYRMITSTNPSNIGR